MSEEIPELPEWVKSLLNDASSKGYERGFENGTKMAWQQAVAAIEKAGKWYL